MEFEMTENTGNAYVPNGSGSYGGLAAIPDERFPEVRGAIERMTNQIASVEVATHELAAKVSSVARGEEPRADSPNKRATTGVELADIIEELADRVHGIDSYLRSLNSRIAL